MQTDQLRFCQNFNYSALNFYAQKQKLKAFSPALSTRSDLELIRQIQRDDIYRVSAFNEFSFALRPDIS